MWLAAALAAGVVLSVSGAASAQARGGQSRAGSGTCNRSAGGQQLTTNSLSTLTSGSAQSTASAQRLAAQQAYYAQLLAARQSAAAQLAQLQAQQQAILQQLAARRQGSQ
jgi:hypothetical protein